MTSEYCPVCDCETSMRIVDDDEHFEKGLECMNCHTIREAEPDELDENENE